MSALKLGGKKGRETMRLMVWLKLQVLPELHQEKIWIFTKQAI